jgi:hypothetical protein
MIDPKVIDRFRVPPGPKVRLKARDPPDGDCLGSLPLSRATRVA